MGAAGGAVAGRTQREGEEQHRFRERPFLRNRSIDASELEKCLRWPTETRSDYELARRARRMAVPAAFEVAADTQVAAAAAAGWRPRLKDHSLLLCTP